MKKTNKVRIISGQWRGRKIRFPSVTDLRPTGDRIRETLFDWLQHSIRDMTCLDLYAGTGALGFEALSRGAKKVVFVENQREVVASLQEMADWLKTKDAIILAGSALSEPIAAKLAEFTFDIIFLDPPFRLHLIEPSLAWLAEKVHCRPEALIYIEAEKRDDLSLLERYGEVIKSKTAGNVTYSLVKLKLKEIKSDFDKYR